MSREILLKQAEAIVDMLPRILRGLFSMDNDDPGMVLPTSQMRVCTILLEGPRSMTSLSRELRISLPAITQIADRLERAGFVERISEAEDRRVKSLQLTTVGSEMMANRRRRRIDRAAEAIERLSPENRDVVLNALNILLEAGIASAHAHIDDMG